MLDNSQEDEGFDMKSCFKFCKDHMLRIFLLPEKIAFNCKGFSTLVEGSAVCDIPKQLQQSANSKKDLFDCALGDRSAIDIELKQSIVDHILHNEQRGTGALLDLLLKYQIANSPLYVGSKNSNGNGIQLSEIFEIRYTELTKLLRWHLDNTKVLLKAPPGRPKVHSNTGDILNLMTKMSLTESPVEDEDTQRDRNGRTMLGQEPDKVKMVDELRANTVAEVNENIIDDRTNLRQERYGASMAAELGNFIDYDGRREYPPPLAAMDFRTAPIDSPTELPLSAKKNIVSDGKSSQNMRPYRKVRENKNHIGRSNM